MERVFDDEDFNAILDQRKKVKLVFYIVLGAYIALGDRFAGVLYLAAV